MKKNQVLPPLLVVVFLVAGQTAHGSEVGEPVDPQNPGDVPERLQDTVHGVKMGVVNPKCDNAKVNISVDFLDDPTVYVCFHPKAMYPLGTVAHGHSKQSCDTIPVDYRPRHYCMNNRIKYDSYLPTHEGHRPLWPVFGEYKYVPPQRWLHNIEHGAIVMLYHPCTHPYYVDTLRNIVTGCLRKHVITPYVHLSPERALGTLPLLEASMELNCCGVQSLLQNQKQALNLKCAPAWRTRLDRWVIAPVGLNLQRHR
ncbi:uncharacterized protein [Dermacentor albipictus]|uniref:uncharacterized protein isoform X4 n=1 Tax=Dermacentor albipictus TaxID=60249 RepID=UPI0031FC594F